MHPLEPAKPLHDAQMCGSFYFYTMSNRIPFPKPSTLRKAKARVPSSSAIFLLNKPVMNKKTIITILLALVAMAGQAQIHYRLEGTIGDSTLNTRLLLNQGMSAMKICSDFHLGRHFFGHVGGFFVGLFVTSQSKIIKSK